MKPTKNNPASSRVTVELPKELEIEARKKAIDAEQSFSEFVASSLALRISSKNKTPVFGKGAA